MPKSIAVMLTVIAVTVLFGYTGAALLATDAGRAVLGAIAALLVLATIAASARALLLRFDDGVAN